MPNSDILITHTKSSSPHLVQVERCSDWADMLDWIKQYNELGINITIMRWTYERRTEDQIHA